MDNKDFPLIREEEHMIDPSISSKYVLGPGKDQSSVKKIIIIRANSGSYSRFQRLKRKYKIRRQNRFIIDCYKNCSSCR